MKIKDKLKDKRMSNISFKKDLHILNKEKNKLLGEINKIDSTRSTLIQNLELLDEKFILLKEREEKEKKNWKQIYVGASVKNKNSSRGNLGDIFAYVVMEWYGEKYKVKVNRVSLDEINSFKDQLIITVGSFLQRFIKHKTKVTFIGTGLITGNFKVDNKNLNFLGVRGPHTQSRVKSNISTPIICDLGLQISNVFKLPSYKTMREIGFIIHSVDRKKFFEMFPELKEFLIDNYADFETFTKQLGKYKKVVSSSLHGIIFCHSYNIPVASIKVTEDIIGDNFKYLDYYHSIGLKDYKGRKNISKDTNFVQLVQDEIQPNPETLKKIKEKQLEILSKFFKDIK